MVSRDMCHYIIYIYIYIYIYQYNRYIYDTYNFTRLTKQLVPPPPGTADAHPFFRSWIRPWTVPISLTDVMNVPAII